MRKLFFAALCAMSLSAMAQTPEVGKFMVRPMVGVTMSTFNCSVNIGGAKTESKMKVGFTIGGEAGYQLNDWFQPSVGLFYSQQGSKIEQNVPNASYKSKMDYLIVPLLANFYVADGFALKVGLQPGFNLSAKQDGESYGSEFVNSFQFQIPLGLSYEYKNFIIDGRVGIPVTKAFKDVPTFYEDAMNTTGQITVGYNFSL